jgi:TPR repeat protein
MTDQTITLNTTQMKQIARYEITFKDILDGARFEEGRIVCPEVYSFTLDDLYHAVTNMKAADPTVREFGDSWFYPISQLSEAFDLDRAQGLLDDGNQNNRLPDYATKGYTGLNLTDSDWFAVLWQEFEDCWIDCEDETKLSEFLNYDGILSDLDRYFSNKGKPFEAWSFSKNEMENYIRFCDNDQFVKEADEKELDLARKFIDQLCDEDSNPALYTKGYACYGGNRLYPCDWKTSRDCMIRLFEKTDEPQYANTLGYIYYYGRCNGGVPEYEKAFHYFSIAAANGLYEGLYKLADMYRHGYACKQSPRTARSLYQMVYNDSIQNFLKGRGASFADAALRMGNVYAKGIDTDTDPAAAYYYYVQADYAAKLRAQENDFFGNTTVVINVQKALEETREQLPKDYLKDHMAYDFPRLFRQLAEDNNHCELRKVTNDKGHTELTAKRLPTRSVPEPDCILVTIPELSLCTRTVEVSYTIDDAAQTWFKGDENTVRFDYCEWNDVECRCDFYFDNELAAWSKSEKYRFYGPPAEAPSGPEYRLASVRFSASGRSYDYICEDPSVKPGDTVIVNGYDGETEVEVVNVTTKRESELALPVERYKKIVRKA